MSLAFKKAMNPMNIRKRFSATCVWPLKRLVMDDKMGPNEVFVNIAIEVDDINEINEEYVGKEVVEEVLGEMMT